MLMFMCEQPNHLSFAVQALQDADVLVSAVNLPGICSAGVARCRSPCVNSREL